MAAQAFLLLASFLVVLFLLARPMGTLLARMINNVALPVAGSVEKGIWRALGIRDQEMGWCQYLMAILLLNIVGLIALFIMCWA
jgi:K+-transporting ATPase, A chain